MSELVIYGSVTAEQQALITAFTTQNGMRGFIDQITEQAKDQAAKFDTTTAKGRKDIASIAYAVAKAKTSLDNHGKELVSDAKKKIKIVDNERKAVRDELDALRDEIRWPVTQFEEAEAARKTEADAIISKCMTYKTSADELGQSLNYEQIGRRLAEISAMVVAENEYSNTVAKYKAETELFLINLQQNIKIQEAQAAELARLKAAEEARHAEAERQQREEAIAARAAEAERERIAREQAVKEAEAKRQEALEEARKADENHRRVINAAALQSFTEVGFDKVTAKKIVCLIIKNQIKHISINY